MLFGKPFGESALFKLTESGIEPGFVVLGVPVSHACAGVDQNDNAGIADEVFPLRMKIIEEQPAQGGNPQGEQNTALPLFEFNGINAVSANAVEDQQSENGKRQEPIAIALDSSPPENCFRDLATQHRRSL